MAAGEAFDPDEFLAEDAPAEFDADAFLASPLVEGEPLDTPPAPLGESFGFDAPAPSLTGLGPQRPDFVQTDAALEQRRAEDDFLRYAAEQSLTAGDDDLAAYRIAEKFGVDPGEVKPVLKDFQRLESMQNFDIEKFRREMSPEVKRLVLRHPSLAPTMVKAEVGGALTGALKKIVRFGWDMASSPVEAVAYFAPPLHSLDSDVEYIAETEARRLTAEEQNWRAILQSDDASAWQREAGQRWLVDNAEDIRKAHGILKKHEGDFKPQVVEQLDDDTAKEVRQGGFLDMMEQRGKETLAGLDESRLRFMRRWEKQTGGAEDVLRDYDERIRLLEEQAKPRYLGEGEFAQLLTLGQQGALSTAAMVPDVAEKGGTGGAVGALVGGIAGRFIPGLGVKTGAAKGFEAGAKFGAAYGAFEASFLMEAGSTDKLLEGVVTDDKQKLTDAQILAGSIFAGTIKASLEVVQTAHLFKAMGPGMAEAVRQFFSIGGPKELIAQLAVKKGFGAALQRAGARALLAGHEEGLEEVGAAITDDMTSYVWRSWRDGRLQQGDVISDEGVVDSYLSGALGGLFLGTLFSGVGVANEMRAGAAAANSFNQLEVSAQVAAMPEAQSAPGPLATALTEATSETGKPMTGWHIAGTRILKFFQDQKTNPAEAAAVIEELLGPEGPAVVATAAAAGARIEVPLPVVLEKWANSPIGKALMEDTAAHADAPTKAEAKALQELINVRAQAIAEDELKKLNEQAVLGDRAAKMVVDLLATGRLTEDMARKVAKLSTALQRVLSERFGVGVTQLLPQAPVEFGVGDPDIDKKPDADPLEPVVAQLSEERRVDALYTDPVTQLRSRRAWDAATRTPGKQVLSLTIIDTKTFNDDPEGGHDVTNEMFASLGQVLQSFDPGAARGGPNFLLEVQDEAQAQAVKAAVEALLPKDTIVDIGLGTDAASASKAMDASTDAQRASGAMPQRGQTRLKNVSELLKAKPFRPALATKNVDPAMAAKAKALKPGEFIRDAMRDPVVPQLLTREAWDILNELNGNPAWVAAFDMKGLKWANDTFGKEVGDQLLKAFGEALVRAGGESYRAAHLSGDEYVMGGARKADLDRVVAKLEHELSKVQIPVTLRGEQRTLRPFFRVGIAERTYGAADRALNAAKRAEAEAARAAAERPDAGVAAGVPGAQPGVDVGSAVRPDPTGGPTASSGADFGPVGRDGSTPEWVTEEVDLVVEETLDARREALGGDLRAEEERAIRDGFNLPAAITDARAAAERFRPAPLKDIPGESQQARLERAVEAQKMADFRRQATSAFIDWVEGKGPGLAEKGVVGQREGALVVEKELKSRIESTLRNDFNIIDPQSGYSTLVELGKEGVEAGLRRAKQHMARTAYEHALQQDRAAHARRYLLGESTLYQRDEALEAKLAGEGRNFSVFADESGATAYWSWADDGTVRIDFPAEQREAALGNDADAARWRDTDDPGIHGATLRSVRAASAPSPSTIEQMREELGLPVRLDGTVSAEELVHTKRLFQTRQAKEWLDDFARHPAVVASYSKKDIEAFSRAVMAHRQLVQDGIDLGLLPDEGDASPLRNNQDFIKSFDISTICPRQDTFTATIKAVERKLGRLLEPMQRHLVGLMLRDVGAQPACWYCYGQAGRNAYDAVIGQVHQKTLMVIELHRAARRSGKKVTGRQFNAIFESKEMGTKWNPESELAGYLKKNWLKLSEAGVPDPVRLRDLARGDVLPRNDVEGEYARVARKFTTGATHANDPKGWATLRSQILDTRSLPQARVDRLNARAGLRMNSQTDFRPWHVIEVSEAIASMKARGLKAHVYTKESGFLRAFGKTGIKFNLSAFYKRGGDGKILRDERGKPVLDDVIGMSAAEVEYWAKELPNDAGGMLVAHNDEALLLGLNDERIHQVIPYHAGPLKTEPGIGAIEGARNYERFQHEHGWERRTTAVGAGKSITEVRVGDQWVRAGRPAVVVVNGKQVTVRAGKDLDASTHGSDQTLYFALCKKLGLAPKFADLTLTVDGVETKVIDHPNYMKLVRDVAREPSKHEVPDPKKIDWEAATDIETKWVEQGGDSTDPYALGSDAVETPVLEERKKQFDKLVNYLIGRINRGHWPKAGDVPTPEAIAAANRRQYGKKGGGTLGMKWKPPTRLNQLPTPEESAEGAAQQVALLDALLEAGAKALEGNDVGNRGAVAAMANALRNRLFQRQAPKWYSAVERAVANAKQEKNTPAAWWALLQKSPGVKAEELKWLGLKEWLDKQKGSVSKADVAGFVRANRIEVREEVLGEPPDLSGLGPKWMTRLVANRPGPASDLLDTAQEFVKEVRQKAQWAQEYAEEALRHFDDDDVNAAVDSAERAVELEGEYGDAPVWGPFLAAAKDAEEAMEEAKEREEDDDGLHQAKMEIRARLVKAFSRASGRWTGLDWLGQFEVDDGSSVEMDGKDVETLADLVEEAEKDDAKAKYDDPDYRLAGGDPGTYLEVTFSLPGMASEGVTTDKDHFGEGVIAHVRFDMRRDADGNLMLFVQEIQSDYFQQGRDKGFVKETQKRLDAAEREAREARNRAYKAKNERDRLEHELGETHPDAVAAGAAFDRADMAARQAEDEEGRARDAVQNSVPEVPFTDSWEEMVFKRILMLAAEKGATKVGWTTGSQQLDRYEEIGQALSRVEYVGGVLVAVDRLDRVVHTEPVAEDKLEEHIGQEAARKLLAAKPSENGSRSITGNDLFLGGTGMQNAYDVRIPSIAKKLTKKHGGTVQKEQVDADGDDAEVWTLTLPPALLEMIRTEGLPLFQPGDGSASGGSTGSDSPKGYTLVEGYRRVAETIKAFLNPDADISTAVHELAHGWLEQWLDAAQREDAPEDVLAMQRALFHWMGVKGREEIQTKHHEKFARSFEAYLMEGKAPAAGLAGLFQAFRNWLVGVYKTLAAIPEVELNDEIRSVFDRMVATDEEIEAYQKRSGANHGIKVTDPALNEEQRLKREQELRDEVTEASRKLELFALQDRLRVTEKWWKDGIRKAEKEAAEEYEALPARKAQLILMGEGPAGEPVILDKEKVQAAIGKKRKAGIRVGKNGVNPDTVAELARFPSGEAMLKALIALPTKDAFVKQTALERMKAAHPSVLEDRSELRAKVEDSLSKYTERRLLMEGVIKGDEMETLKRAAWRFVEMLPLNKLTPSQYLTRERRAAQRKAIANARGNWEETHEAARDEALAAHIHRAVLNALKVREALESVAADVGSQSSLARMGKAQPLYRDAAAYILQTLGLPARGIEQAIPPGVLDAALDQMKGDKVFVVEAEWLEPLRAALARIQAARTTGAARPGSPLKVLKVEEAKAVMAALKQIRAAARFSSSVMVRGKAEDKAKVIEELIAEAKRNKGPAPSVNSQQWGPSIRRLAGAFTAPLLKIETMVDWLGGALKGQNPRESLWHLAVFRPLEQARQKEAELQEKYAKRVLDAWNAMPRSMRDTWNDLVDGAVLFPDHTVPGSTQRLDPPSRRYELVMMALHSGNTGNLSRLLGGRTISLDQLVNALNLLTAEEIAWVNAVGEAFEAEWPAIADMEERITGLRPVGVDKRPLPLKNGTINGHYFPAIYDPRIAGLGVKQSEDAVEAMFNHFAGVAATRHGHTKKRADNFVGVLSLEPGVIPVHLAQHMHDLAFREAVMDVWSLVSAKPVQDALFSTLGVERGQQFVSWVRDAALAQSVEGAETAGIFLKGLNRAKANLTVAAIGYSVPNFFEDLTGVLTAVFDRELEWGAWAGGVFHYFRAPLEGWDSILQKSKAMKAGVGEALVRDLSRELANITLSRHRGVRVAQRAVDAVRHHAFGLIDAAFRLTAGPAWLGRYEQELERGADEETAVEAADALIRRMFPNHSAVNQAGILRNKMMAGFIQFYGFFSTALNKELDEWQRIIEQPGGVEKMRAAGRAAGYLFTIALLGALAKRRGPAGDEPPEKWASWTMLQTLLSMFPFGGDLGNLLEARLKGRRGTARPTLVGAVFQAGIDGLDVFEEDVDTWKRLRAAMRFGGLAAGIPSSQPIRTGNYVAKLRSGELPPQDALDVVLGLLFGPPRE